MRRLEFSPGGSEDRRRGAEDTAAGFEEEGRDHELFWGFVCLFGAALGLSSGFSLVVEHRYQAHKLSCPAACGILVPQPRIEPTSPCAGRQILNHRTTREVPHEPLFVTRLNLTLSLSSPLILAPLCEFTTSLTLQLIHFQDGASPAFPGSPAKSLPALTNCRRVIYLKRPQRIRIYSFHPI